MISFRDEGEKVKNGFNIYPHKSGLLGLLFVWDGFSFACYQSKANGRVTFGRFFCA